jgi:thiol-disulfide isomerase/thioredoxin
MNFRRFLPGFVVSVAVCSLCAWFITKPAAMPNSHFVTLPGQTLTDQDLQGKVTLVNFWATSCTSCVAEMPELVQTYERYKPQGFRLIAVAMSYDPAPYVLNFAQSRKLPFDVALDTTGKLAKDWGDVTLTPTTYLVNKQGHIVKKFVGTPDFAQLHSLIEKLLKEST